MKSSFVVVILGIFIPATLALAQPITCDRAGVMSEAVYIGIQKGRPMPYIMGVLEGATPEWPEIYRVELATIGQLARSQSEALQKGEEWCKKKGW